MFQAAAATSPAPMVSGRPPVATRSSPSTDQSNSAANGAPTPKAAAAATNPTAGIRNRPSR